jgi:hypothetical protein
MDRGEGKVDPFAMCYPFRVAGTREAADEMPDLTIRCKIQAM